MPPIPQRRRNEESVPIPSHHRHGLGVPDWENAKPPALRPRSRTGVITLTRIF